MFNLSFRTTQISLLILQEFNYAFIIKMIEDYSK